MKSSGCFGLGKPRVQTLSRTLRGLDKAFLTILSFGESSAAISMRRPEHNTTALPRTLREELGVSGRDFVIIYLTNL